MFINWTLCHPIRQTHHLEKGQWQSLQTTVKPKKAYGLSYTWSSTWLTEKMPEVPNQWKVAKKTNGPRAAPLVHDKLAHETLNHTHSKIISWFRAEFRDVMKHMEKLGNTQSHESCPHYSNGKTIIAPFKQDEQNRYALLGAVSSDTTGQISPADKKKKKIQLLVNACSGWSDVQTMKSKSGAGNAIIQRR